MNDLKNKNIIVTGATGGIGNSIIKKLHELEANVLASGTKVEKLEKLKKILIILKLSNLIFLKAKILSLSLKMLQKNLMANLIVS